MELDWLGMVMSILTGIGIVLKYAWMFCVGLAAGAVEFVRALLGA